MRTRLARSLRRKLIGIILLTTLVALFVAIGAIVAYDLGAYHRTWVADIESQAELLSHSVTPPLAFDDASAAKEDVALLGLRPQVQAAAVYTARGVLFASYVRPGQEAVLPRLPEADGTRIDGRSLLTYRRVVKDGEILGTVYLRTDYALYARVQDYVGIGAAVVGVAMLIAYFISARLQQVVTRPLLTVAAIAQEVVDRGDYSRRAEKLSEDEIGILVDSFNRMLAEIERRTGALTNTNIELGRQVAERERAEREVLRLNSELEERVRERTIQLESANRELEAFCYSVSHDLRAPLRAIDGFGQALQEDFPQAVPADAARYLARIRSATQRMGQLIEDLLNLSRVSREELVRSAVDLSQVARQVVDDLAQRDPGRTVDVVIRDGMVCNADPRLLRTALENLIGNAWKFSSRTERARIEVGSLRDGNQVIYFVRDNGAGFDMAYADKLFGAFQRLHAVNEFSGTGIGLATVQRIVHRHGGRIWADAQVGKGAAFYFTVEATTEAATAAVVAGDAQGTPTAGVEIERAAGRQVS